jgi:hypothetical protein
MVVGGSFILKSLFKQAVHYVGGPIVNSAFETYVESHVDKFLTETTNKLTSSKRNGLKAKKVVNNLINKQNKK